MSTLITCNLVEITDQSFYKQMEKKSIETFIELIHQYPDADMIRFKEKKFDIHVVYSPELIEEVLVKKQFSFIKSGGIKKKTQGKNALMGTALLTTEGEEHKQMRKSVQPMFQVRSLEPYAPLIVEKVESVINEWKDGEKIDVLPEMQRIAYLEIMSILFGKEVPAKNVERIYEALLILDDIVTREIKDHFLIKFIRLPKIILDFSQLLKQLNQEVYELIHYYKEEKIENNSLVSQIMKLKDENGNELSDKQLRDHIVQLILAGVDTVSHTLTWTLYLLSQHSNYRGKLLSEMDAALEQGHSFSDLHHHQPLLEQFIHESMRIYPVAHTYGREAIEDVEIGGYPCKKGDLFIISPYAIQRHPAIYPDPEVFDPERFAPDQRGNRYTFVPFGAGLRKCLGKNLAILEMMIILSLIIHKFEFYLPEDHPPIEPEALSSLRPKNGLYLIMKKRKS